MQGVEELEETDQTADNLDLQETFLLAPVIVGIVVCLRRFHDYIDQLLDLQRHLQVLLLNLHEHPR